MKSIYHLGFNCTIRYDLNISVTVVLLREHQIMSRKRISILILKANICRKVRFLFICHFNKRTEISMFQMKQVGLHVYIIASAGDWLGQCDTVGSRELFKRLL